MAQLPPISSRSIDLTKERFPDDPLTIKIPTLPNGEIFVVPYHNSKEIKQYMHPEVLNVIESVYPSDELHLEIFRKYLNRLDNIPLYRYKYHIYSKDKIPDISGKLNIRFNRFLNVPRASRNIKMMHQYLTINIWGYLDSYQKGKPLISTSIFITGRFDPDTQSHEEIVDQKPLSADDIQTISDIYKEYTARGYVWNYFGFFKADHPLYLAYVQKIKPTIGTFELANTLIPNNVYTIEEQLLFKTPNSITNDIKNVVFKLGIETPTYSKMINPIQLSYKNAFYHIGPERDYETINNRVDNRRQLITATFGSRLVESEINEYNIRVCSIAIASGNHNLIRASFILKNIFKHLGWTKKNLIDAIRNSGLIVRASEIVDYIKSHYRSFKFDDEEKYKEKYKDDNRRIYYGILPYHWLKIVKQGKVDYFPLRGFSKSKSATKLYYMTLYRKIFGTLGYIDWTLACQQRILGIENLRSVAQSDYCVPKSQVDQMDYDQLCNLISQLSIERRNNALARAKEAVEIFEPLIYQPGNVHLVPSELTLARMGATAPKFHPTESVIVPEIVTLCANPNSADRRQLLNIASNLDLPIRPDASNEEICRIINSYLQILRGARRLSPLLTKLYLVNNM